MVARSMTQRDVANIAGMTEQMFTNVVKGRRLLSLQEADAIRRAFGFVLPEDVPASMPVAGRVGSDDHVELSADGGNVTGTHKIARPGWLPRDSVAAAVVEGAVAEPLALNGDIIFWRRQAAGVHNEDLGRPVVAELEDGRVLLKRLASSPQRGRWSLLSINPAYPNVLDARIRWAARVLAPLPADEVCYLDA